MNSAGYFLAALLFLVPFSAVLSQVNSYKAPLYWSVYEYNFLNEQNGVSDNYIPESVFSANIDWVDANLKRLGYTMVAIDGWGDVTQLNTNGYRKSHSSHWEHDYAWWSAYLQGKGMTLGIYGDPLWIHVDRKDTTTLINGTNIPVSTLIDTTENAKWFTWVQVDRPGAEQYVKGYIRYYAGMGVKYFRVDFLSWYESGQDRNLGTVGPARAHEDYVTALRWMREAADSSGMFLSLVMPNLFNEAEVEQQYGNSMRIDEDAGTGQWQRWSDNARGVKRTGWSVYANAVDGLTYWSYIAGRNKIILDPDFLRLNTFANTDEKKSVISASIIAGGPVEIADQYNTIGGDLWLYSNTELLALNRDGFAGKPLTNDPTQANSQIWTGQMSDSSRIVGLFNRENSAQTRSIDFSTLGISGNGKVRDLWTHTNIGTMPSYSATIPPHGCIILKVVPENDSLNGPGSMHVQSLVTGTQSAGGGTVRGTATVVIDNENGDPVGGATVNVIFGGSFHETASGSTGNNGTVTLVTSGIESGVVKVNASIINVAHDSLVYDPARNIVTQVGTTLYLGATFNGWKLAPMDYKNGYWKLDSVLLAQGSYQLKFANTNNWTGDDWGNAQGTTGTSSLSTGGKPNISFTLSQGGYFDFLFDETSLHYAIVPSGSKRINGQMFVAGTFSWWALLPMTFRDTAWELENVSMSAGSYELKFANTSDWSEDDWGNASGLTGTAQLSTGGKPNISFLIPESGTYTISFNDIMLTYSIASPLTSVAVNMQARWNMISLHVLPGDNRGSILYPSAVMSAYRYTASGYTPGESLYVGIGYWLKFRSDTLLSLRGLPVSDDTIEVGQEWNMIGSISTPVIADSIMSIPGNILQSKFFGYGRGYTPSDTLVPGKGYWVKTKEAGKIILKQY